jgi:hypothetical protein
VARIEACEHGIEFPDRRPGAGRLRGHGRKKQQFVLIEILLDEPDGVAQSTRTSSAW